MRLFKTDKPGEYINPEYVTCLYVYGRAKGVDKCNIKVDFVDGSHTFFFKENMSEEEAIRRLDVIVASMATIDTSLTNWYKGAMSKNV